MALPERYISNQEFAEQTGLNTNDEAIRRLTGIEGRYWVEGHGEHASDLGAAAAHLALKMSGLGVDQIDNLYVSTTSPDYPSPSVSSLVHGKIGAAEHCAAIDLNAACAGGVIGLREAAGTMMAFGHESSLVIGSEVLSPAINLTDRRSAILFGDGAGAATIEMREGGNKPHFATITVPDRDAIYVPAGGNANHGGDKNDLQRRIHMDGKRVAAHAGYVMSKAAIRAAGLAGLGDRDAVNWEQIDHFVPHQANQRLIEGLSDYLKVPQEKRVITVNQHANTSSASILLALAEAHRRGQIEPGRKRVLFAAIGAGMVGAGALIDVDLPG
jgi:3-oxoacyl-[acyl-carrier-protein] synthase-3